MKPLSSIDLGSSDAQNYRNNRESRKMFESVFVKDENFDRLMRSDTYFLIGDKGTGKTAYAVFLEGKEYKNTMSKVIDIDSTNYDIFMKLEKLNLLQLSDFSRVWKIILLMLMANEIEKSDISIFGPKRSQAFETLKTSIDDYYDNAFTPEVSTSFRYVIDNTIEQDVNIKGEIKNSILGLSGNISGRDKSNMLDEYTITKFQNNLLSIERTFCDAFKRLKLSKSRFIFIDNIDIKAEDFSSKAFDSCIRGLGQAIWDVNTNVFRSMPESKGFLKVILSIRTDLFSKLSLHNQANKVRDNGIFLDWRTTYESYRKSKLFKLCNRLLAYDNPGLDESSYWDYYFPWHTESTRPTQRVYDSSFINCMRYSLSRPRDMVSIMKAIQNTNRNNSSGVSSLEDFENNSTENEISNYYIDEASDWCYHRFSSDEFNTLLFFFQCLNGRSRFSYSDYEIIFNDFTKRLNEQNMIKFKELDDKVSFLQILFDLNMICYLDKDKYGKDFFRFCYREREIHNLSPKVKTDTIYIVHYALLKALNLGRSSQADYDE